MKYGFDKLKLLLLAVGIVFVGFIFTWFKLFNVIQTNDNPDSQITITSAPAKKIIVSLTVDRGNGKTTVYDNVETNEGESAYSLLVKKMNETGSTVTTKTYDFGLMVETVDGISANSSNFWSYSVNGVTGSTAADKYILQNGEKVEWKFTPVQM